MRLERAGSIGLSVGPPQIASQIHQKHVVNLVGFQNHLLHEQSYQIKQNCLPKGTQKCTKILKNQSWSPQGRPKETRDYPGSKSYIKRYPKSCQGAPKLLQNWSPNPAKMEAGVAWTRGETYGGCLPDVCRMFPDASQTTPRCLPVDSQMLPGCRCLPGVPQMPSRCFADAFQVLPRATVHGFLV